MSTNRKIFWIMTWLVFAFGLIWGYSVVSSPDSAWIIPNLVFLFLGIVAFVVHTALEVAYKTENSLGNRGASFLFGMMLLGEAVITQSVVGLIGFVILVLVSLVFRPRQNKESQAQPSSEDTLY